MQLRNANSAAVWGASDWTEAEQPEQEHLSKKVATGRERREMAEKYKLRDLGKRNGRI